MNFVFYSQIFVDRRSYYFMEGMVGIDRGMDIHVEHCQPESEVVSALSVYVTCMLGSIYEYKQNMAAMKDLCYSGGGDNIRGTFPIQYVHLDNLVGRAS
jgi:hypothetical protein